MNEISKFFDGRPLTIIEVDGEHKFRLSNLCQILELGQVAGVKRRLDKDVISNHPLQTAGGTQTITFVNEDGLYDTILDSRKPEAKRFRKWITSEVLPSIRKTGSYQTVQPTPLKENFEMQLIGVDYATRILRVDETSKIKMLEDAHKQHHVPTNHLPEYVDEEGTKSMTELLKEHEVGIGPVRMNNKLVEVGLLETVERPSSKGKIKTYRSITQHGLKYGKNLINQRNPRETQAHWYPSKFNDLLKEAGV